MNGTNATQARSKSPAECSPPAGQYCEHNGGREKQNQLVAQCVAGCAEQNTQPRGHTLGLDEPHGKCDLAKINCDKSEDEEKDRVVCRPAVGRSRIGHSQGSARSHERRTHPVYEPVVNADTAARGRLGSLHRFVSGGLASGYFFLGPRCRCISSLRAWATTAEAIPFELSEVSQITSRASVASAESRLESGSWGSAPGIA